MESFKLQSTGIKEPEAENSNFQFISEGAVQRNTHRLAIQKLNLIMAHSSNILLSALKGLLSFHLWQVWMPSIIDYVVVQSAKPASDKKVLIVSKTIFYSYLLVMTFRLLAFALVISLPKNRYGEAFEEVFYSVDLLMGCFTSTLHFVDSYMILATTFSPFYVFFVDWAIYFGLDTRSQNFFHDYLHKNGKRFWELNFRQHLRNCSIRGWLEKLKGIGELCVKIWFGKVKEEELTFQYQQLVYLPTISKKLRAKAVLLTVASSLNIVLSCVVFCKRYNLQKYLFKLFIMFSFFIFYCVGLLLLTLLRDFGYAHLPVSPFN